MTEAFSITRCMEFSNQNIEITWVAQVGEYKEICFARQKLRRVKTLAVANWESNPALLAEAASTLPLSYHNQITGKFY